MNGTIQATAQRTGIVTSVSPSYVTVRIQQQSACSACHARAYCVSTECAERELRIKTSGRTFALGQVVTIAAEERVGRLAVLLAFVIPLFLLVTSLVLLSSLLSWGEGWVVLASLSLLAVYYLILYALRTPLAKELHLEVLPLTPHHD